MAEREWAEIQEGSHYPAMSLTRYGDPVLKIIDDSFLAAQQSREKQNQEEALAHYQRCVDLAIELESPLHLLQYSSILIQSAYVYTFLGNWEDPMRIYDLREKIILQLEGWQKALPPGLKLIQRDLEADESNSLLMELYRDKGLAHSNLKNFERCPEFFLKSARHSMDFGKAHGVNYAADTIQLMFNVAYNSGRWEEAVDAGRFMEENIQINTGLRLVAEAYIASGNQAEAIKVLDQLIPLSDREAAASHRRLKKELKKEMRGSRGGFFARLFGK
ncbi:MAG: hypothetical protein NXI24_22190 [bacterium]|nr:hypothetical protein [bacterium]